VKAGGGRRGKDARAFNTVERSDQVGRVPLWLVDSPEKEERKRGRGRSGADNQQDVTDRKDLVERRVRRITLLRD